MRYRHTAYSYIDRYIHSREGKITRGISPISQMLAILDWILNLSDSPGKIALLMELFLNSSQKNLVELMTMYNMRDEATSHDDIRFRDEEWEKWPYRFFAHSFLRVEDWWRNASTEIGGFSRHHQNIVCFVM
ncbi:MAG: poly-beta-hydroxybutyrate polymerase N-terminal domain-containing protein, partial [Smithella sp.]